MLSSKMLLINIPQGLLIVQSNQHSTLAALVLRIQMDAVQKDKETIFDAAVAWRCIDFWLAHLSSSKKETDKKWKERKGSRQTEETALCCCSSSGPWGKDFGIKSSRAETKAADKQSKTDKISLYTQHFSIKRASSLPNPQCLLPLLSLTQHWEKQNGNDNKHSTYFFLIFLALYQNLEDKPFYHALICPHHPFFVSPKTQQMTLYDPDTLSVNALQWQTYSNISLNGSWRTKQRKRFDPSAYRPQQGATMQMWHILSVRLFLSFFAFSVSYFNHRNVCKGTSK